MYEYMLPLSEEEVNDIWENGLIVLDTNILLNLYRFNIDLRQKLLEILKDKNINAKIWIPNKVYEEFLQNRVCVISEQWDIEQKISSKINKSLDDLKNEILKLKSHKHHPYINVEYINELINICWEEILKTTKTNKDRDYNYSFSDDSLLSEIRIIIDSKVETEISDTDLEGIYKQGKERYAKKIPPGYEDEKKGEPRCYADLVIWKSILNKAKTGTDVIFVVDDKKEDWWRIEKGKTVGPRLELLKEMQACPK